MRVLAFKPDKRFAERRRLVVKVGRVRIEARQRVEPRRSKAEYVKGIEHDDIAHRAPVIGGDGGEFALRIDDDDRAILDREQVGNEKARSLARPVRAEQEQVTLALIRDFLADAL